MSSHLPFGETNWSRRRLMSVLAAVAASTSVVLIPTMAQAEEDADAWLEYRRDDLGFRVEMPGEPKVEVKEEESKGILLRSTDALVEYDDEVLLNVHCSEYRDAVSAEEEFRLFRAGMRLAGLAVTGEKARMINGVAARDFIRESDDINFIRRLVVVGNRTIAVSAHGDRDIHDSAAVRRFLDSLVLLGGAG
jgi:hypothetical protein